MGCLVAIFAGFFPRIALVVVWIATDYVDRAFDSFLLPLIGLFVLPLTTLVYALAGFRECTWVAGAGCGSPSPSSSSLSATWAPAARTVTGSAASPSPTRTG